MKEDIKMNIKYGKRKGKHSDIVNTLVVAVLLLVVFLNMVSTFYTDAEQEAYETLHIQTKQIKDDLILQIKSDRENLATMANFASKLYLDGDSFDIMFDSFKPIGLFTNIGVLNPNNVFLTKKGSIDLTGKISFEEEVQKGEYISGRVNDLTRDGYEIIRSAVPIKADGKVVGILYGVILPETINNRYNDIAKELNAQLFVYNKSDDSLVVNSIGEDLKDISFLENREYINGYSYEGFKRSNNGYTAYKSIYTGETLYLHYSTIEDFNWGIMLGRYESQVFNKTHRVSVMLLTTFMGMALIIAVYLLFIMNKEKRVSITTACASNIRKLLLEINQNNSNIMEALGKICEFSLSLSAFFVDTDGEDYYFAKLGEEDTIFTSEDKKFLLSELFYYAAERHKVSNTAVGFINIKTNNHLLKTNGAFYDFLKSHNIKQIPFAIISDKNNHVSILGTLNPKRNKTIRMLLEDIAVCFSIAIFNKKHLHQTETAATTDSLTGAANRVSYKKDILLFDEQKPEDFSCIYIDVNELHMRNNKYGHAAGDEMLIYIANTLKEVFYGHHIYRMGGDEFLVFTKDISQEHIKTLISTFINHIELKDYHVAIGLSYRKKNINCEELVREAEIRMYEAKSCYYQNKEKVSTAAGDDESYIQIKTGISEIDTMISVMKSNYNGIYKVSLNSDNAHRILMPSYLGYNEKEDYFSKLLSKYIEEFVHPDYKRAVESFLNYDAIKRQLSMRTTPKVTYKKTNGESVVLSIHKLEDNNDTIDNTLWVFAKR